MSATCDLCGTPFGNPADLIEHRRRAHKNDDPALTIETNPEAHRPGLVCALCGHRFPTPRALADHNLRPHPSPGEGRWYGSAPG